MSSDNGRDDDRHQPIFNLPPTVFGLVAALFAVFLAADFVLDRNGATQFILWFGYIPYRLTDASGLPGGVLPMIWTPVTHAFLHAGWEHLLLNIAWLAIFGTPVARRYGDIAFLIAFLVGAVAGAAAYTLTSYGVFGVLVGASGGVAALTGVAIRFIFQPVITARHPETGARVILGRKIATIPELFKDRRTLAFIVIWIGLNGIVPLFAAFGGGQLQIAWQAHIGGFVCGVFMASLFEPRPIYPDQS